MDTIPPKEPCLTKSADYTTVILPMIHNERLLHSTNLSHKTELRKLIQCLLASEQRENLMNKNVSSPLYFIYIYIYHLSISFVNL